MNFTTETKVREIAAANSGARKVLEEARIDYCCGGERRLGDACVNADVSAEQILKRLAESGKQARPEELNWSSAELCQLTHHIRTKHHKFVRDAIPRLRALLSKVKSKHAQNHPELGEIEERFLELAQEMYSHMQKEEQILFPYIEALERAARKEGALEPPFFQTVRNPVHMMMKEHDSAGEALRAMRSLSGGYQAPAEACESYRELYRSLEEFELDMHTHVHLENNILFPRAVALEDAVI